MEDIYTKFNESVQSGNVAFHHSATAIGYIRKKDGIRYCEYKGRFGEGFTVEVPNCYGFFKKGDLVKSNNIHRIDYYIKK